MKSFGAVDRSTKWKLTNKIKLDFPTFHTEGIAFAGDRIFLSAVEILLPTVPYVTPIKGYDRSPGAGVGHLFVMDRKGKQLSTWPNTSYFIDYQDCQYVPAGKMICGGVTNLQQTTKAGGALATYELGGLALIDLHSHEVLRETPFQQWSTAGHVATRNPVKLAADGDSLTMWAAPDNGEEGNGTEILTYRATVEK